MGVKITRVAPVVLPAPKEVIATCAQWPDRRVKLMLHPKGHFGGVQAPVVSLHFSWSNSGRYANSFGAGACYTLEEAQEIVAAFSEAIEALSNQ